MTRRTTGPIAWLVAAATLLTACASTSPVTPTPDPVTRGEVASGGAVDRERPGPSRGLRVAARPSSPAQLPPSAPPDHSPYVVAGVLVGVGLLIAGVVAVALSAGDWDFGFGHGGIGGAMP